MQDLIGGQIDLMFDQLPNAVDFRGSLDFAEWRKLVGHCFAAPPEVEHVQEVVKGF
jgi:hypothetical protein